MRLCNHKGDYPNKTARKLTELWVNHECRRNAQNCLRNTLKCPPTTWKCRRFVSRKVIGRQQNVTGTALVVGRHLMSRETWWEMYAEDKRHTFFQDHDSSELTALILTIWYTLTHVLPLEALKQRRESFLEPPTSRIVCFVIFCGGGVFKYFLVKS